MNEATVTLIGFTAATLTTASFVPQALHTLKTRRTKDLSLGMYLTVTTGLFIWLLYGIFINSTPIIAANATSFVLAATILFLKLKHG